MVTLFVYEKRNRPNRVAVTAVPTEKEMIKRLQQIFSLRNFLIVRKRNVGTELFVNKNKKGRDIMINTVILMGRLTADPELRTTPSGIAVCRFTLAVERNYAKSKEERQSDFISCIAWRQYAEFLTRYFVKGQLVAVTGSIQTSSYNDRNGVKRYSVNVVADSINFTGDKRNKENKPTKEPTKEDEPPLPEPPDTPREQDTENYIPYDDLPF